MAYRLSLLVFLIFLWVSQSYSQTIEKINVKTSGWKDISQYLALDLDLPERFKKISSSPETSRILAFYKAYKDEFSANLLKNLIGKEDVTTRKKIFFYILSDIQEKKDFDLFYKHFGPLVSKPEFEDINFFYHLRSGRLKDFKSKKNIFSDLKDINLLYHEGNYNKALDLVNPYKNVFPRIYTILLLRNGLYSSALEYLGSLDIDDKDYFRALTFYYLKRYDKVIEILSNNKKLDYKEKILLIEAMTALGNYNIPEFGEEVKLSVNAKDDFSIFNNIRLFESLNDSLFKERTDILYIKWQIRNYAYNLSLYLEEINKFQESLKNIEKELSSINSRFDKVYEKFKEDAKLREAKDKVIAINEMYDNIKKFKKKVDKDAAFLSFFEGEYEKERKNIDKLFADVLERYKEEMESLRKEIYLRKVEKVIFESKNLTAEDIKNILSALKKLEIETDKSNRNYSFLERISYYQIYLVNELIYLSQVEDMKEIDRLANEGIGIANKYLEKFSDRKSEVILFLAETYEFLGEKEKALRAYEDYLKEKKEGDFRIFMKIAELLFEKKDYGRAINYYEKAALASKAYKDSAYYKIGWAYYLSHQYEKVINLFLNYKFESAGQRQELLLNEMIDLLSRAFYKLDNLDLVEKYLDRNRQFPYPDKVFKYLGDIYLYLADYEKAIAVYRKGWEKYYLYKNSYEIALSMIDAYNFMGKQDKAYNERVRYIEKYNVNSEYYKKYKEFPSGFSDEIVMTALYFNTLYDKEKNEEYYDLAVKLYEIILEYFPKHKRTGEMAFMLAQLYEEKGNNKKASRFFKEARKLGFNEEESHYRSLYCEYKMWQRHEILSKELINTLQDFLNTFKGSKYFNNSALLLADISLKEGLSENMFFALELAANNDEMGLKKAVDFVEANFDSIHNKLFISKIFEKGYERLKDDKFLKLKHFSLFKHAISLEEERKNDLAINVYKDIIKDKSSEFTEFAVYNLSLLLQRVGKTEEAISYMAKIKQKDDLKLKAKDFIYNFGKQKGMFIESAQAALDYAALSKEREVFYLIESSYLFLKGRSLDDAERVLLFLEKKPLSDREKKERDFIKGLVQYHKNNYDRAYDLLMSALKEDILSRFDSYIEEPLYNVLSKIVFTKPEDEAREALELYVGYLSKKYKDSGDDSYLYKLGYIMSEFSIFFLQQEEANTRAVALLKRVLKNSVEKDNKELLLKSIAKLREIEPKKYNRKFVIEKPKIDFERLINYESLIK